FTGKQWDAPVSLQFNEARYYDPKLAKWISMDPIGFAAGDANLYRYVANNSTNWIDPSGLEWSWGGAWGGLVTGGAIGAGTGAVIGAPAAGIGAAPGALIGGIVGGFIGFIGGGFGTRPILGYLGVNEPTWGEQFCMGLIIGTPAGFVGGTVGPIVGGSI